MAEEVIGNLADVPDLSGISDGDSGSGFADGWYQGMILEQRAFTDKNGNDRIFESQDAPSQGGDSRNIRLQVAVVRQADKRTLHTSILVNYRPEDLSQETVQAITAAKERNKETGENQWGPLFRSFMALNHLGKLQKIAGVRQFQRSESGGLDLRPLYDKVAYVRLGPDDRNPQFKSVVDFRETKPSRVPVL